MWAKGKLAHSLSLTSLGITICNLKYQGYALGDSRKFETNWSLDGYSSSCCRLYKPRFSREILYL